MVVVVDRHADVVQHAGGPEQLALLVAERRAGRPPPARRTSAARAAPRARTCSSSVRKRWARFSTDSRRTSSSSGGSRSSSRRSKKTPSRRPASVTSSSSKPPCSIAAASTSAPPRITSPRSGLMPRTEPRLDAGRVGQLLDQLLERVAGEHEALHVDVGQLQPLLRRGGEVADRAADARPGGRRRRRPTTRTRRQRAGHVLAQRLDLLGARLLARQERLADPHRAEPHRLGLAQPRGPAIRISCTLPPPMSIPKPSSSVVELAIAR